MLSLKKLTRFVGLIAMTSSIFYMIGCTSSTHSPLSQTQYSSAALHDHDTAASESDPSSSIQDDPYLDQNHQGALQGYQNENTISKTFNSLSSPSNNRAAHRRSGITPDQIEHALELCESAQTLWEQGELDKALVELDAAYASILTLEEDLDPELNQQKEDLRFMISKRILEIYASRHIIVKGEHNAIPLTMNSYVEKEIKRFTGPEKKFFLRSLERSGRYRPYIVAELKKAGLPEELSWLPLIESGFQVKALSPARALGLWQFIPSTGYKFGLKRNYYIDERLDPIKSTHAAISYMTELHKIFGDWATVLAAYNCGEGRVLRTIRKQKVNYLDNFWDLYKKLPSETARYVPRFLATLHIINNFDKYGITPPKPQSPIPFETVTVNKQIHLNKIAESISASTKELKTLNPELKYALLPPDTYQLRIPNGKSTQFLASIDKLTPAHQIKQTRLKQTTYAYHRVRRGETLSSIAHRYGTTTNRLAKMNHMSTRSILKTGKKLKVPGDPVKTASRSTTRKAKLIRPSALTPKPIRYTVKPGDNLWIIAKKYNSTTKAIQVANRMKGASLHIGQTLTIPPSTSSQCTVKKRKKSTYWVKSGDSPFTIAQKYNMTLQRLLALNHLTKRSKIYPGQKLLVE